MERVLVVLKFVLFLEPALLIFVAAVNTVPPAAGLDPEPVLDGWKLTPWYHKLLTRLRCD